MQNPEEMNKRMDKMKENQQIKLFLVLLLPTIFLVVGLMIFPPWGKMEIASKVDTMVETVEGADKEAVNLKEEKEEEKKKEDEKEHSREKRNLKYGEEVEKEKVNVDSGKELSGSKGEVEDKQALPKREVPGDGKPSKPEKTGNSPRKLKEDEQMFRPTTQKSLNIGSVNVAGRTVLGVELKPTKSHNSSVRVYKFDNFLTDRECNGLIQAHKRHAQEFSMVDPIFCFDHISTLKKHLRDAQKKLKINESDYITGTYCLDTKFSAEMKTFLKWSSSTAFYPGESPFTKIFEDRVKEATGLNPSNGGKFQVTSYPQGVGYKTHTDCILDGYDFRDRMGTILVYLQDVAEGGETIFPELGIKVKPTKGMAIVWNNMDERGNCDPLSLHTANEVVDGHKYILQRWYYYKSFLSLGQRPPEPDVPERLPGTARVSCDEYEHGSCRWYDEWNYDHLIEYQLKKSSLS